MPVELRPYQLTDHQALVATIDAVCAECQWMETTCYTPNLAWEHAFNQPDCSCHLLLVAQDNAQLVGWCRAFPEAGTDGIEIGIGLLPAYRGQGIGAELMSETIRWAQAKEIEQMILWTRPENQIAVNLFEKCGFQRTGNLQNDQIEMIRR